ncbi:MAG: DNA polymerase III subunit delta' [Persicimonas sp.]
MQHWSDIRGQTRPLDILKRALDTGRVHHAYLFTGLKGVGKFLTAKTFTAIVNCTERPEGEFREACGECSSCRKIEGRQHPDVHFVEPTGEKLKLIKIAQIREIEKASHRSPYEGRFRIVLIDEAHTMTEPAANALLKTLEEPSARMRLILVTDQPHGLLDTIISRCQVLRFGALEIEMVVELLEQILDEREEELDEPFTAEELGVAARYGEGSVGRSLAVLDSGMLEAREEFLTSAINLPAGEAVPLLNLAESLSKDRRELEKRLDVLKLFFRDVMLYLTCRDEDRLVNIDLVELIADYAERVSLDDALEMIDEVREAQRLMMRNVNSQLITEELLGSFRSRAPSR